jgi:hypothetical protein
MDRGFHMTTFVESSWSKMTEALYYEADAKNCEDSFSDEFRLGEFSK